VTTRTETHAGRPPIGNPRQPQPLVAQPAALAAFAVVVESRSGSGT
jgi:hypothetical protein